MRRQTSGKEEYTIKFSSIYVFCYAMFNPKLIENSIWLHRDSRYTDVQYFIIGSHLYNIEASIV